MKFRLTDNRGNISSQDETKATGQHFNSPGHSLYDLTTTILEKVRSNDNLYRKEREKYFILSILFTTKDLQQTTI
jgi:hypothetical protein